jgi:glycosyltransferase involved in cell wall biosynthesis
VKKIGIYNPYLESKGGGEKVCLALAEVLSRQPDVEVTLIAHKKFDIEPLAKYFNLDLSRIRTNIVDMDTRGMKFLRLLPVPGGVKVLFNDIKIFRKVKKARYDLFINNCFQSNLPGPSTKNVYMCMFPQKIHLKKNDRGLIYAFYSFVMRNTYRLLLHPSKPHAVYTYDRITANSVYTQNYVKKYWGLDSEILFPICDNMLDQSIKKEKIILNVGRFFEKGENHHKRHDFLVSTFAKMTDIHKDGWELHIAGSVAENVDTLKYLLELIDLASGIPVIFHFNAPFKDIKKLYNQSAIYWHATGFGSDPDKFPEKQEHFGISTLEAMSTGSIPVVINSAGQKEVVKDGEGFLWTTQQQLIELTNRVVKMSADSKLKIKQRAEKFAEDFNEDAFAQRVKTIFESFF